MITHQQTLTMSQLGSGFACCAHSRKPPRLNPFAAFGFMPATNSAIFFAEFVEQELIQQGIKRFSVRNQATPPSGQKTSADVEQLHIKHQISVARNGTRTTRTICCVGWAEHDCTITHHHFAQSLCPGRNHAIQGERNLFIALDGTIEHTTIQERAFIVHFND
jgi:hypothetical protein